MGRALIAFSLLAPIGLLVAVQLNPSLDVEFHNPLFHFYVVTFATFAAVVGALFIVISLGRDSPPRHRLTAAAFATMGGVFFIHGVATPEALTAESHPAVTWAAWLTLWAGGLLFALAALDDPNRTSRLNVRAIFGVVLAGYGAFVVVAAFAPGTLIAIDRNARPWHTFLIFLITLAVWVFATIRLRHFWRITRERVDGTMALVGAWLTLGTISLHGFPTWHLSWWLYHILLLVSFLTVAYTLAAKYERLRQFNLTRYYAASGSIVTAALALLASDQFARSQYDALVRELQAQSIGIARNLAANIVSDLPDMSTPADLRDLAAQPGMASIVATRLAGLDMAAVHVIDDRGIVVFSAQSGERRSAVGIDKSDNQSFQAALSGQPVAEVYSASEVAEAYASSTAGYAVETYVPIRAMNTPRGAPLGTLSTLREEAGLQQALPGARATGLFTAGLSMGLLFVLLLGIVRRADRLLTARRDELAHAYADLRAAEAMRDDLTGMIVHDLRTPLTTIIVNLDLMERVAEDPLHRHSQGRFLSNARDSSRRMIGLINNLLDVSRLEAGQLQPMRELLAIPVLLHDRAEAFGTQAEADDKRITATAPADLPLVLADPTLVSRVLDNLISNALKYTDRGGRVALSAEMNQQAVIVRVQDDGEGVPPEYAERIFDKFAQALNANGAPLRQGAGLGLTFCKLAVEAHGGRIWVESAPGRGSTFLFTLPVL